MSKPNILCLNHYVSTWKVPRDLPCATKIIFFEIKIKYQLHSKFGFTRGTKAKFSFFQLWKTYFTTEIKIFKILARGCCNQFAQNLAQLSTTLGQKFFTSVTIVRAPLTLSWDTFETSLKHLLTTIESLSQSLIPYAIPNIL